MPFSPNGLKIAYFTICRNEKDQISLLRGLVLIVFFPYGKG